MSSKTTTTCTCDKCGAVEQGADIGKLPSGWTVVSLIYGETPVEKFEVCRVCSFGGMITHYVKMKQAKKSVFLWLFDKKEKSRK